VDVIAPNKLYRIIVVLLLLRLLLGLEDGELRKSSLILVFQRSILLYGEPLCGMLFILPQCSPRICRSGKNSWLLLRKIFPVRIVGDIIVRGSDVILYGKQV
jgi:hypothetical protein